MIKMLSSRINSLPPYLFAEIDRRKRAAKAKGVDLVNLGIGDPDQPTPGHIIRALSQAARDPANHGYALDQGIEALRRAISAWFRRRFGVSLSSEDEILPLIGSKEGLAHLPLAFVNNGDYTLVPEPCYPPYKGGTILAGGRPYILPLLKKNSFLPALEDIPRSVLRRAKILFLNYPNNPTAAVADISFYQKVVDFAHRHKIIVAQDAAYSEISFDGYRPISFLEAPGAKEVGVEFHSLSKTYNMAGWRLGWVCGNKKIIAGLAKVKANVDSGIFSAVQLAGAVALSGPQGCLKKMQSVYQGRRDVLLEGLRKLGWAVDSPRATFYVWAPLPKSYRSSMGFARMLLDKAGIVVTPGYGFGPAGEGYIRMALTASEERIKEAARRLEKIL